MYLDAFQTRGDIVVWTRDDNHKLHVRRDPAPYYLYHFDQDGPYKTIFGHSVSRLDFASSVEYSDYRESHSLVFESDIPPINKYLSDNFYHKDGPVHKGLYDIEVDYDLNLNQGYPTPENPYGEITSVSLFDVHRGEYHLIMLNTDTSMVFTDEEEGFPVINYHCVTERQLLDTFLKVIDDIDVLTAWNGDQFDLPYILARLEKYHGADGYSAMCRDGFRASVREFTDKFGNDKIKYELAGRVHLDMLELYQKFTFEQAASYKLDNIAEKELKKTKRKFPGDLGELYRNDPRTYFDYSLHDTRLLKQLDDKKKLLDLVIRMARQATVRFMDVLGSIKYLESSIRNYCHHDREQILILPDRNNDNDKEPFEGAFVLDMKVGVYGWCQSIDLASLYPSVIRAINISPETHLLQCLGGHNDFVQVVQRTNEIVNVREVDTGEISQIRAKDLHQLMLDQNMTISANGSLFDNTIMGIIPEVLAVWYKRRKDMKKESQRLEKAGDKAGAEYYDMLQAVAKIGLNSLYGAISNPFSRFYTIDCAKSVTITGQEINKHQMRIADMVVKQKVAA